jgi:hypothetical protein
MAIGYANFGTIQQGNQQVVNSMAGLGQSISSAIETQAATQSAQAMLPMLQQQYQQGMQKIASGDPNGMGDIYGAAMTASQNPLLATMAKSAIETAQSANVQAQQGLRTLAAQQGMMNRYAMRYGSDAQQKPMTAYQTEEVAQNAAKVKDAQINEYGALYEGDPSKNIEGIGGYATKINTAINNGEAVNPEDLSKFASMYSIYKQKQSAYGKNAVNNVSIDKAYDDIKKHLTTASSDIDKKIKLLPKGADPSKAPNPNRTWYNSLWTTPTNDLQSDKDNLDKTLQEMENIRNIGKKSNAGGIPAAGGQTSSQTLMQAVQAAQKHPDKIDLIKSRLQGAGIDPSMLDQAIKSQQTQRQSSPQASNMIPAANQTSDNVETEEEE